MSPGCWSQGFPCSSCGDFPLRMIVDATLALGVPQGKPALVLRWEEGLACVHLLLLIWKWTVGRESEGWAWGRQPGATSCRSSAHRDGPGRPPEPSGTFQKAQAAGVQASPKSPGLAMGTQG